MIGKILSKSLIYKPNSFVSTLLKQKMHNKIPKLQASLKELQEKYGESEISKIKVEQVLGGMRGIQAIFYDTSALDPRTV